MEIKEDLLYIDVLSTKVKSNFEDFAVQRDWDNKKTVISSHSEEPKKMSDTQMNNDEQEEGERYIQVQIKEERFCPDVSDKVKSELHQSAVQNTDLQNNKVDIFSRSEESNTINKSKKIKYESEDPAMPAAASADSEEFEKSSMIERNPQKLDTEIEIKEETFYEDVSAKVKLEDIAVQEMNLVSDVTTIYSESEKSNKNSVIPTDYNDMDTKIEIKEENISVNIKCERETSASDPGLQFLEQDNVLCTTRVSPTETSRFYKEETSNNISNSHIDASCGVNKNSITNLYKLKKLNDGKRPYKCSICENSFAQSSTLKRHQLLHTGKRPYVCGVCGKSFIQAAHLKQHQLVHQDKKPYTCGVCGNGFTRASTLKQHQLIHEGKRPHTCTVCGKTFTHGSCFRQHRLIHEGIRPHTCDVCGKSFTHPTNLKQHKLIHEKKLYTCSTCGKNFNYASTLKNHQLIHEGKRPHACGVCGYASVQACRLQRGNVIHEGKQP